MKYSLKVFFCRVSLYVLPFLAVGCGTLGPSAIKGERINYNSAIQRSNDEQLLLNLVRLKYRDTPFFMEVTSVSSQLTFSTSAEANVTIPEKAGKILGLGGGAALTEKPTVTYTPLQGEKFIQHLLTPVQLDTILLLYHSGWSVKRILHLCLQRINGIKNAPSASGPTPAGVPIYKDFVHVANLLRVLQSRDALDIAYEEREGSSRVVLRLDQEALDWKEVRKLTNFLKIAPGKTSYVLTTDPLSKALDQIIIEPRSLLGIMFYLSQSVEAPARDQDKITITQHPSGEPFHWNQVTGEILTIHSLPTSPEQASVAVEYRGSWFYINDSDLTSKSTFSLLSQLFALQAGKIKSQSPILTLPIGQ